MLRLPLLLRLLAAGLVLATLSLDPALAVTVQPVVIDLSPSGSGMSRVITVENNSATPMPVEIRVDKLSFGADGVQSSAPSDDLLVFPPQAVIPPGRSQAIRVQWAGDRKLDRSQSYYVTVAQLPVKLAQGESGVEVVYNFQVLVSVGPVGVKPKLEVVSAVVGKDVNGKPAPVITVRNTSATHGYLSNGSLKVIERDASGAVLLERTLSRGDIQQNVGFGLIAPSQERRIALPVVLPAESGRVEVQFLPAGR